MHNMSARLYFSEDRRSGVGALYADAVGLSVAKDSTTGFVFLKSSAEEDDGTSYGEDDVLATISTTGNLAVKGGLEIGGDIVFDGGSVKDRSPWEIVNGDSSSSPSSVVLKKDLLDSSSANVGIGTSEPKHKLHVVGGVVKADAFSGSLPFSDVTGVPTASASRRGTVMLTDSTSDDRSDVASSAKAVKTVRDLVSTRLKRAGDTMQGSLRIENGGDLTLSGDEPGRCGIGTGTPEYPLHVVGDVNFTGSLLKDGNPFETLLPKVWHTSGGGQKVFLGSAGTMVGIGTSDPRHALHVEGGDLSVSGRFYQDGVLRTFPWSTVAPDGHVSYTGDGNVGIGLRHPSHKLHVQGSVYASGEITQMSDARSKSDLRPLVGALDKLCSLTGYSYFRDQDSVSSETPSHDDDASNASNASNASDASDGADGADVRKPRYEQGKMKESRRRRRVGLVAQEVEAVLPEAVIMDDSTGYLGVNYGNVVALLVQSVKELREEVRYLRSERERDARAS